VDGLVRQLFVSRPCARLTRLGYYVSLKPVGPESSYEPSSVMELSLPQPKHPIAASHNPLSMPDSVGPYQGQARPTMQAPRSRNYL
jgi:hypothetical protein